MTGRLVIRELSMVVVGKNHNPSILNPDFLKFNDIVPRDWSPLQAPICTEMIAQVVFTNGLSIVSQQDKIIFSEPFVVDGAGRVQAPEVVSKYLKAVPHVAYEAVGVNPKGHISFDSEKSALTFMTSTFLAPGRWLDFGNPLRATAVKFSYDLEERVLNLTIETGSTRLPDSQEFLVVLAGNFHHELTGESTSERLESALRAVEKWKDDVADYRKLIDEEILAGKMQCT